jgi:hypothetical protein
MIMLLLLKVFPSLTEEEVTKLTDIICCTHQMLSQLEIDNLNKIQKSICPPFHKFIPPSEEEIKYYQNELYPNWMQSAREYIRSMPTALEEPYHYIPIFFKISNNGIVPAENIIIQFEIMNGLLFAPPSNPIYRKQQFIKSLPVPPSAPQGKWRNIINDASGIISLKDFKQFGHLSNNRLFNKFISPLRNEELDPNAFYWKHGRPQSYKSKWYFECKEFRHKADSEIFRIEAYIKELEEIKEIIIMCKITASNLPQPKEIYYKSKIEIVKQDTFTIALIEIKKQLKIQMNNPAARPQGI